MASLTSWPRCERPRERLAELGAAALSDSELLALLLGSGTGEANAVEVARRTMLEHGGLEGLAALGLRPLSRVPGIGDAKAARIVAALELGVRLVERASRPSDALRIECSADVFEAFRPRLGPLKQEVLIALGLNARNAIVCEAVVAKGTVSACRVEPREIFRPLIAEAASRALLIHNHPSGDPTPSPEDVALTGRLARAGEIIGIPLLDHIVVARASHSSLRDLGLLAGR